MNHKIRIIVQNLETADEVSIDLDTKIVKKKFTAFKTQVLNDAVAQVADGTDKRQGLQEKNQAFLRRHSKK